MERFDAFLREYSDLEGLARELGQTSAAPLDLDALSAGVRSRPTLWGNLIVSGAVLLGVATFAFAVLGGKP